MTLRDRRADKKNALTLICLFNLDNIKSTIWNVTNIKKETENSILRLHHEDGSPCNLLE